MSESGGCGCGGGNNCGNEENQKKDSDLEHWYGDPAQLTTRSMFVSVGVLIVVIVIFLTIIYLK